ncbi:MAG TPA: M1 family metallopeptidase, partial [Polyangiaceae bacterium]|nr:M1 family metallopeptidase [Polyangiaceae bacterium]
MGQSLTTGCSSGPNFISTPPDVAPPPPPAHLVPPVANGDERLSRKVEPLAYRLEFAIDPARDRYRGSTQIHVRLHESTSTLRLHAQGLDFDQVFAVRAGAPDGTRLAARLYPGKNAGLALAFDQPLDGEWLLEFHYSAPLEEVPMSLYRARDGEDWYAFTQFEALAAREAFPCFDEPQFKTPFTTSIITPASMKAASNAPLARTTPLGSETRYDFETTEPLPTYLVALAVGNFDVAEHPAPPAGQPPQRILTVRGKSEHTAFALRQSSAILAELSKYFGSPYPYKKLDQVAVPSFRAGAMENAGLVTYREQFLIIDDARGSVTDKLQAQSIIAHELAHMWFGNLVTMQWWDDLWLNEAFATWMSNVVLQRIAPETEPELDAVQSMVEVMEQDALRSATPVRKRIENSGDIDNAFDRITYVKGLSVLRMLEHWVGRERFRTGVQSYLARHAWKNATMFDLFQAIDKAAERPVSPIGRTFVEQTGVPLVDVRWSCKDRAVELELEQRRYVTGGAEAAAQTWSIPVCLKAGGAGRTENQCFLFDSKSVKLTPEWGFCPAFVHPNAGEMSYYRWQIDPQRFLALTREFRAQLTPAERVALPSHAFALLEAGTLDGATYLAALEALGRDEHRLVLEGVLDGLGKLNR